MVALVALILFGCSEAEPPTDESFLAKGELPPGFEAASGEGWVIEESQKDGLLGTLAAARLVAVGTGAERRGEQVVEVQGERRMYKGELLKRCGEVEAPPELKAWVVCDRLMHIAIQLDDGRVVYGMRHPDPRKDAAHIEPEQRIQLVDVGGDGTVEWLVTHVTALHERYESWSHRTVHATLVHPGSLKKSRLGSVTETVFDAEALGKVKENDRFISGIMRIGPTHTTVEAVFFDYHTKGWTNGMAFKSVYGFDRSLISEDKSEPVFLVDGQPTPSKMLEGHPTPLLIDATYRSDTKMMHMSEVPARRVVAPDRGLAKLLGAKGGPTELVIVELPVPSGE